MQLVNAIGHNSVGHIAKAELNKYGKHFSIENLYKISKILDVHLHFSTYSAIDVPDWLRKCSI